MAEISPISPLLPANVFKDRGKKDFFYRLNDQLNLFLEEDVHVTVICKENGICAGTVWHWVRLYRGGWEMRVLRATTAARAAAPGTGKAEDCRAEAIESVVR